MNSTTAEYIKPLVIYLIAGEASGDLLGAHLMRSIRAQSLRPVVFHGIGGDKMEEQGMVSLFPYHDLSMMGFVEIIPYIARTMAHIGSAVEDIMVKHPDILITIDSPGFNFRVVEKLRKEGLAIKFVHYVAPTVWAYKPERAEKCAKLFDHMLLLLPFEPPYFENVGLPCTFVGHPVICETTLGNAQEFRDKYEISKHTMLITLLPGSRKGEIKRHLPVFARTTAILSSCYPLITLVVAVPDHAAELLGPYLKNCPFRVIITSDEQDKKNAFAASDFALVKSGTVALEVAMAGVPMLITYKVNSFSAWWLKRMIITKYANLVNILLNREAIPELLQENCDPVLLASSAAAIISSPERKKAQKNAVEMALKELVPPRKLRPSDLAAEKILSLLS